MNIVSRIADTKNIEKSVTHMKNRMYRPETASAGSTTYNKNDSPPSAHHMFEAGQYNKVDTWMKLAWSIKYADKVESER